MPGNPLILLFIIVAVIIVVYIMTLKYILRKDKNYKDELCGLLKSFMSQTKETQDNTQAQLAALNENMKKLQAFQDLSMHDSLTLKELKNSLGENWELETVNGENIKVTAEFKKALESVKSGNQFVLITGGAGTGKSTLIKYIMNKSPICSVILAPTGIAVLNVKGVTIHSFCEIPPKIITCHDIKCRQQINQEKLKLIDELDRIIIDEISMVRADVMDAINIFLQQTRLPKYANMPFGGVQIIMIGDLYQLPPVVESRWEKFFKGQHTEGGWNTKYFFSAKSLRSKFRNMPIIELTKVFRQKDSSLVSTLNDIRIGKDIDKSLAVINSSCRIGKQQESAVILTAKKSEANKINSDELNKLDSEIKVFTAKIQGTFDIDFPAPYKLTLKTGARVMFIKNDYDEQNPEHERQWVNGTTGTVTGFFRINDKDIVSVKIDGGRIVEVSETDWENYTYVMKDGVIKSEIIGIFTQIPLMLAWAFTIHKGQGKTISKIHIEMNSEAFAPGQTYVALSRCPSFNGMSLCRKLNSSDIKLDYKITEFFKYNMK